MAEQIVLEFVADGTGLDPAFKAIQDSERKLAEGAKVAEGAFNKLSNSVKDVGKNAATSLVFDKTKDIQKTDVAMQSLKKRIKEAVQEAQRLAEAYGELDPRTVAAAKRAGELKERLSDVNKQIEALNPEAKFNAFIQVAGGVAGALAAAQGAMALFGAESEDARKTLVKLQGALNLAQGLNAVAGLSDSFKNLRSVLGLVSVANTKVEESTIDVAEASSATSLALNSQKIGTQALTAANIQLNKSFLTNPIFLVVAAVAALAVAFIALRDDVDDAQVALDSINDSFNKFERARAAGIEGAKTGTQVIQNQIDLLKAQGSSLEEIAQKEIQLAEYRKSINKEQINANNEQLSALEATRDAAIKNTEITADQYKEFLTQYIAQKDALTKSNDDLIRENDRYANEIKVIGATLTKSQIDEAKTRAKEEFAINSGRQKAKVDLENRLKEIGISLIDDEFEQRRKTIELNFDKEIDIYAEQLNKKAISLDEFNKVFAKLDEKKNKDLEKVDTDFVNKLLYENEADFNRQAEKKKKADAELVRLNKDKNDKLLDDEKKAAAERAALVDEVFESIQATSNLINQLSDNFSASTQSQIDDIQDRLDAQLEAYDIEVEANENAFKNKTISEREFRKNEKELLDKKVQAEDQARNKERELRKKEAEIKKTAAIFEIIINTAVNVSKAGNPFLAALQIALGAAQIALVSSQPVPQFNKGTLKVPGHGTSDTVHAMLTPGESVMTKQNTADYMPVLHAIHHRTISPKSLNELVSLKINGSNTSSTSASPIDYDKLARAIVWRSNLEGKNGVKILNVGDFKDMFSNELFKRA